jgi:hypothetical protein
VRCSRGFRPGSVVTWPHRDDAWRGKRIEHRARGQAEPSGGERRSWPGTRPTRSPALIPLRVLRRLIQGHAGAREMQISASKASLRGIQGVSHPSAKNVGGNSYIQPGERIPLIPKQTGKAFANCQATSKLAFDLSEVAVSSSYARERQQRLQSRWHLLSGTRSLTGLWGHQFSGALRPDQTFPTGRPGG